MPTRTTPRRRRPCDICYVTREVGHGDELHKHTPTITGNLLAESCSEPRCRETASDTPPARSMATAKWHAACVIRGRAASRGARSTAGVEYTGGWSLDRSDWLQESRFGNYEVGNEMTAALRFVLPAVRPGRGSPVQLRTTRSFRIFPPLCVCLRAR
uniref:Uncharacterized protein n=1 Tax=Aegilops tauschii subsp. strangulata TaxID=200361 RepID=A0A453D8P8_AEGTS